MLAEERPRSLETERCARETYRRTRRAHSSERRVIELAHELARADLLVLEDLIERVQHAAGNPGRFEQAVPVIARLRRRDALDLDDELLVVPPAQRSRRDPTLSQSDSRK